MPGHGPQIETSLTTNEAAELEVLATGKNILEVGAAYGYSTVLMAKVATHVISVDPHSALNSLDIHSRNLGRYEVVGLVDRLVGSSAEMLPSLNTNQFDLIFIDGDHTLAGVSFDLDQALRLIVDHGYIAFHDWGEETCPDVRSVLDQWRQPDYIIDTLAIYRIVKNHPSVSVITPTWQRHLHLERAIISVRAQDYPVLEHIVISDGPDPTLRISQGLTLLAELSDNHADWGVTPRKYGAAIAKGDILAYLDDDNIWRPNHLSLLVAALLDSGADFAYSQGLWPGGLIIGSRPPQLGTIDTSLIIHKRPLLERAGWMSAGYISDWNIVDRWLTAGASWTFVEKVTMDYRPVPL